MDIWKLLKFPMGVCVWGVDWGSSTMDDTSSFENISSEETSNCKHVSLVSQKHVILN